MNELYYGDNLDVLRRYVKDESIDLVYLDPPFNSNQDYNVLFAEQSVGFSEMKGRVGHPPTCRLPWITAKHSSMMFPAGPSRGEM